MAKTKLRMTKALPNKPSELILTALRDLRAVEKMPDVRVNMYKWVQKSRLGEGVCLACFAGASMIQNCSKVSKRQLTWPSDFSKENENKFYFLNIIRQGHIAAAFDVLGLEKPDSLPNYITVADYHRDRETWFRQMRNIARRLARLGQ